MPILGGLSLINASAAGAAEKSRPFLQLQVSCCATSDLLFCRSMLLCNPMSGVFQGSRAKVDRLTAGSALMYDRAFLLGRADLHSNWMPATSLPTAVVSIAEPAKPVTTRAGLIADNELEPEFPIISKGSADWAPLQRGEAKSLRVTVRIDDSRHRVDLVFTVDPSTKLLAIELAAGSLGGNGPWLPLDMPRARRAGAAEGEPLHGRIARMADGKSQVELSRDPVDLANNQRRILGAPWLDFRFTDRDDKTSVITIEKGRAANEMLAILLKEAAAQ